MIFTPIFCELAENVPNYRTIVQQGGTSSTKTYSTLQFLIVWALKSKKKRLVSIVAESIPHLKRGALRDFKTILINAGIYNEKNENKTDKTYQLGSFTFEFFSADNDAKLRGARRDVLYVNECNNITYDAFTQLDIRTREKVFLDFNPVEPFWVHENIIKLSSSYYIHSTYKKAVDHITGKPVIEQSIIDSIESRKPVYDNKGNLISGDENFWAVYGLGEVGTLEGVIFKNWVTVTDMPEHYKWVAYGIDFGYTNDPTAIVKVMFSEGELYIKEICYKTGLTNPDIIQVLRENEIPKSAEIIADSAEPKSIAEIKREYPNIKGVAKGKDSIMNGIDVMKRYRKNVHHESLNVIHEFKNYQWLKRKDGGYENKPSDSFNHCFSGDTLIQTNKGLKPIKDINCYDKVLTREGYKSVVKRWDNGVKQVYKYLLLFDTECVILESTENHNVLTDTGWQKISKLKKGDVLYLHKSLMGKNTTNTQKKSILQKAIKKCIGLFGSTITAKFLKIITFIMSTVIAIITIFPTLILYIKHCILGTKERGDLKKIHNGQWIFIKRVLNRLNIGIKAKKVLSGIKNTLKITDLVNGIFQKNNVFNAKKNLSQKHIATSSVQTSASQHGEGNKELMMSKEFVKTANKNLQLTNIQKKKLVGLYVLKTSEKEVFDLMVQDKHEYFANDLLVHNCADAIRYVCITKISKPKANIIGFNL